jgi:hypothetical protein
VKLLAGAVRLYWLLVPASLRRNCLFRETCSQHVFRVSNEAGDLKAIKALYRRVRVCRPGYRLELVDGDMRMILVDGTVVPEYDIAPAILSRAGRAISADDDASLKLGGSSRTWT